MNGIFIRKKFNSLLFLMLLCGLYFIGMYIYSGTESGALSFLILGILICLVVIPFGLFNRGAFIQINEDSIKAKYHLFGKIDCKISDTLFVMPQMNTLTILLKNGKRHVIMGIKNPQLLAAEIRRKNFTLETQHPESLHKEIEAQQAAKKKKLIWVIVSCIIMFANIFLAAALTGGREMHAFSNLDWFLFVAAGIIEIVAVVAMFIFADQCGKYQLPIAHLKHRLKGAYIAFHPLPPGNAKRIYTDINNTGRLIVCGFPNDESVYCIIQQFMTPSQLETVHTTEIYENESVLAEDLTGYIDITTHFQ